MRRYNIEFEAQSVSVVNDLIVVAAPATMVVQVMRAWIGQDGNTTSEQGRVLLARTSGSNVGTSITPAPLEVGDPASSITCSYLPSSNNTAGAVLMGPRSFNWVTGDEWVPAPEERIIIPPSGKMIFRLDLAPSAAKTVSCGLVVMEIG